MLRPKAVGVAVCVAALLAGCGGHKSSKKNPATTTGAVTQSGTPMGPATGGPGTSGGVNTPAPINSGSTGGVSTANPNNPNDDHADGATGATQVGLSTVAQGKIEVAGDVDAFAVTLRAGFDYTFATLNEQPQTGQ